MNALNACVDLSCLGCLLMEALSCPHSGGFEGFACLMLTLYGKEQTLPPHVKECLREKRKALLGGGFVPVHSPLRWARSAGSQGTNL